MIVELEEARLAALAVNRTGAAVRALLPVPEAVNVVPLVEPEVTATDATDTARPPVAGNGTVLATLVLNPTVNVPVLVPVAVLQVNWMVELGVTVRTLVAYRDPVQSVNASTARSIPERWNLDNVESI